MDNFINICTKRGKNCVLVDARIENTKHSFSRCQRWRKDLRKVLAYALLRTFVRKCLRMKTIETCSEIQKVGLGWEARSKWNDGYISILIARFRIYIVRPLEGKIGSHSKVTLSAACYGFTYTADVYTYHVLEKRKTIEFFIDLPFKF